MPRLVPNYHRNLPHLRLEGATYFVTFRQADSIPHTVLEFWKEEYQFWLKANGVDPAIISSSLFSKELFYSLPPEKQREFARRRHRLFFVELDKCHGSCQLKSKHDVVAKALDFFHGKRVWIGDYVVMPNHVHALVQPFPGERLEDWLSSIKRFTSREINKGETKTKSHDPFWQAESYDRIVRSRDELIQTRLYIAKNPVKLMPGTYTLKTMEWLDEYCSSPY